jgi:hypothetical protein
MHSSTLSKSPVLFVYSPCLTSNSLPTDVAIPLFSKTLYQRQHHLTNYQYYMQSLENPPIVEPKADMLACISSVRLHLGSEEDCNRAASVITRTPDIIELCIYFGAKWDLETHRSCEERCNDFIKKLFCMTDTQCQFPRLQRLSLEECALAHLGPVLSQSIDFSKLEELRLVGCADVGRFLWSLGLQRVKWNMLHIEEGETFGNNGELNAFLQTMAAPKVLSVGRERSFISWWGGWKSYWTDLVSYSSTLESLGSTSQSLVAVL